jgi:hypothetical protein
MAIVAQSKNEKSRWIAFIMLPPHDSRATIACIVAMSLSAAKPPNWGRVARRRGEAEIAKGRQAVLDCLWRGSRAPEQDR